MCELLVGVGKENLEAESDCVEVEVGDVVVETGWKQDKCTALQDQSWGRAS